MYSCVKKLCHKFMLLCIDLLMKPWCDWYIFRTIIVNHLGSFSLITNEEVCSMTSNTSTHPPQFLLGINCLLVMFFQYSSADIFQVIKMYTGSKEDFLRVWRKHSLEKTVTTLFMFYFKYTTALSIQWLSLPYPLPPFLVLIGFICL